VQRVQALSDYELSELGDGRYALRGDVSFRTAESILRASDRMFNGKTSLEIDLADVSRTDSAGLALLLEWMRVAARAGGNVRFTNIPEKIQAIAVTADLSDILQQA
jgi:phospholipid transport system transporter-binding protein